MVLESCIYNFKEDKMQEIIFKINKKKLTILKKLLCLT